MELLFYRFGDAIGAGISVDLNYQKKGCMDHHGHREREICVYIFIYTCNYQHIIATLASRTAVGISLLTDDLVDEFLSVATRYTVHNYL